MQEALSINPVAAAALAPALMTVELVGSGDFATVWHAVASSSTLAPDEAVQFSQLAQACNLPVDFVQALDVPPPALNVGQEWTGPSGTLWRVAQAIDRNGRFLPDDESTEARESLRWLAVRQEH